MNELLALLLTSNEAKMSTTDDHFSCLNDKSSALEQANSSGQFPNFLKQLLKSHLSGKFYLGLPKKFCDAHLPSHDDSIVLVDESEHEYNMKYSVRKNRLSGGWRGFSIAHGLVEGDALVFHLIEPCKFRVNIIRASKLTENDVSISVQTCDYPNIKPISAVKMEDHMEEGVGKTTRPVYVNSLDVGSHHETKRARLISNADSSLDTGQHDHFSYNVLESNRYSEPTVYLKDVKGFEDFKILDVGSHHETKRARLISNANSSLDKGQPDHFSYNVLESNRYSEPTIYFKDVKGFEDFKIQSDGLNLDSEIPTILRTKYYNLCCSQKSFLHDHLIKGLSSKLAVAVISEITNIADAIRSADLATSLQHLESWVKTLKAFEDLGMAVGFLVDRVQKLVTMSREYQSIVKTKRAQAEKFDFEFLVLARAPW